MSVLPSLVAALERASGECLVLRSGERPHVLAGEVRHDVGANTLSVKAVEALASQILSAQGLKEFSERASVQEVLGVEVPDGSLTARAERVGSEIYVELRRHRRVPKVETVAAPETPIAPEPTVQAEAPASGPADTRETHVAEPIEPPAPGHAETPIPADAPIAADAPVPAEAA